MLRDVTIKAQNSQSELPGEGRALARCPLANGLGLDALASSPQQRNERLSPSLEQLALRLHFPDEYRMIEDWMLREDELLSRTLGRCIAEVRRALQRDADLAALASFHANGRVKSSFSLVKKLLRQRGVSRTDLKAEAVRDLLALEVIISPDPAVDVPKSPKWLAEEWRERAACFAALDALQRYARETSGWSVMAGSTRDYITSRRRAATGPCTSRWARTCTPTCPGPPAPRSARRAWRA